MRPASLPVNQYLLVGWAKEGEARCQADPQLDQTALQTVEVILTTVLRWWWRVDCPPSHPKFGKQSHQRIGSPKRKGCCMGDCCRRVVVATVLLAACTCVLATSRVIECSVEAANLAKSGRVFQERALSPEVIADGVPPLFTVTSVAISAFDRSFPDNTLRGVDVSAETADGFPASSENACGVGSGMLCPRGFPCERDDQCAIGSICSSNRICSGRKMWCVVSVLPSYPAVSGCTEFDPVPTAAFFDVGLALLGVRPIQYAQYHLEGVIREAVVTTIGRGMSMSDVGVISVTATPSSHCPALFVTVRVSVANPVVWSSIWCGLFVCPGFRRSTPPESANCSCVVFPGCHTRHSSHRFRSHSGLLVILRLFDTWQVSYLVVCPGFKWLKLQPRS